MSWLNSDRDRAWLPPRTRPIAAPSAMNTSGALAGTKYAATTSAVQPTSEPRMVRLAPARVAIRPSSSAPPNATNCTIKMVTARVASDSYSSWVP